MATLSGSALVVYDDARCAAPAFSPGAGACAAPGVVRVSFGFWRVTDRRHHLLSGVSQVQRDYRESTGRCNRRKSWEKRRWQCSADVEKSDGPVSETAESSPSTSAPNCCADAAEQAVVKEVAVIREDNGQVFETYGPGKRGNQLIALASVTVAVGLFLSGRLGGGGPGLPQLAAASVSYEEALSNGRPTVLEFYADWCEVCKETARDVYQIEQEYKDRINFVMLNVDNYKWEEELDEFGVEGIPHFAFLDNQGNEEGNIVGRLPRKILKENLAALARGDATVPHSRVVGQFSSAEARQAPPVVGPRSHSQMS